MRRSAGAAALLPFWLANLVDRMWPAILHHRRHPAAAFAHVPPLYTFRIRSRVFRWYRQLRQVKKRRQAAQRRARRAGGIEKRVEQVTVPLSYADELYSLRTHIRMWPSG